MEILVEHSKMRKDASKLRNHDFKMKFVELDVLFLLIITTALKNVSFRRYRDFTILGITRSTNFGEVKFLGFHYEFGTIKK